MKIGCFLLILLIAHSAFSQERNPLGTVSENQASEVQLKLVARTQAFKSFDLAIHDRYDTAVSSPKSVLFSLDGKKYYVNSLEGYKTVVYDTRTHKKLKEIKHVFTASNNSLIKGNEATVFNYLQSEKEEFPNHFKGKPVESCLSHNGKFLWVTYYRRDWDKNAQFPSALAIIDTEKDEIVRVMPTGPLPKMIAASPDNKFVAVTHWGDNTVGIISINSENPSEFKYIKHCIVGQQAELSFDEEEIVDRDNNCGSCLRGTVFTDDSKYLLVGKMGGSGGIMVFNTADFSPKGTLTGMMGNVRHLVIVGDELFLSSNKFGYVQKCKLSSAIASLGNSNKTVKFEEWKSSFVGLGARTISVTKDGKYIFAAVNNENKIAVVRSSDMKVINSINADPYPVGMALSKYETRLIVTAQGKNDKGGNSVTIYSIEHL